MNNMSGRAEQRPVSSLYSLMSKGLKTPMSTHPKDGQAGRVDRGTEKS